MRLQGKVAIVTGGAQGFGLGIVERFIEEGCAVMVADVQGDRALKVAESLKLSGASVRAMQMDVTRAVDWRALVESTLSAFGRLDIVVNNAGVSHKNQPLLDTSEAEFDRVYAVNVKSMFHSAQACVPVFRKNGGGCFINIASTAGIRPRPGLTWYNGTKGAMITTGKSMAAELAKDKIRVNMINPVAGETPLLATFMGEDTPERRAAFTSVIPMGRFSQPRDIANAALYLASDDASFVTGACIEVDGGRCV
jgi:3-oxoacyl-[acyl-carrier protein] reductase